MNVPGLSNHPRDLDEVRPSTGLRASPTSETELRQRAHTRSTMPADEIDMADLLHALAGSCCHIVGADCCVLTVTSPAALANTISHIGIADAIPRQVNAARIDTTPPAPRMSLMAQESVCWPATPPSATAAPRFVEVAIHAGADVAGRLGLAAKHDHTGFTEQNRDTATRLATIVGNTVRLVAVIQGPRRHVVPGNETESMADAIVSTLHSVGNELIDLAGTSTPTGRASIHDTVGDLGRAVLQIQSAVHR